MTATVQSDPTWEQVWNIVEKIAQEDGCYAGYPRPVSDLKLRLCPSFPSDRLREGLEGATLGRSGDSEEVAAPAKRLIDRFFGNDPLADEIVVNEWRQKDGTHVLVCMRAADGKRFARRIPYGAITGRRLMFLINTMGSCGEAHTSQAESQALLKLKSLITAHHFEQYFVSGMFLESSQRSNVIYLFRKLRPTIAISCARGMAEPIASLCLHPLAYYGESFTGALCPTDDVICHLLMMRSDEHFFWRKAVAHAEWEAESGL